jgi:hypothetical protein
MKKITTYIGEQLTGPESDARYGVDATNPYTIEARGGEALDAACRRGAAMQTTKIYRRQIVDSDGRIWLVARTRVDRIIRT